MDWRDVKLMQIWVGKFKGKGQIRMRKILEWNLEKRWEYMDWMYQHGNEPSDSIKGGVIS
jgi:hypothetical protein